MAIGGDSAGGNLAAGVAIAMRDGGGPRAAMQLLIYPAAEAVDPRPSRALFADGPFLNQNDIDHCEAAYLPDRAMGYDPYASIMRAPDLSGCPPPTSPPPASTRSATRPRSTRCGCGPKGSRWRSAAIPA